MQDNKNTNTPTKVTYGQNYGVLPTPTKDGYIFDGWYKKEIQK